MSFEKHAEIQQPAYTVPLSFDTQVKPSESVSLKATSGNALRAMDVSVSGSEHDDMKLPDGTFFTGLAPFDQDPEQRRQWREEDAEKKIGGMDDAGKKVELGKLSNHLADCLSGSNIDQKNAVDGFQEFSKQRGHDLSELAKSLGYRAVADSLNKALESKGSLYRVSIEKAPPEYNLHGPTNNTTHKMNLVNAEGKTIFVLGMGKPEKA